MPASKDEASFWTRLFRCTSTAAMEAEIRASGLAERDADSAVAAWRAHRAAALRDEARAEVRAREIESVQSFGRAIAEARAIDEVLDRAAAGLQELIDADAVAIADAIPGRGCVMTYLARAMAREDVMRLEESVALGFVPLSGAPATSRSLESFDRMQGVRAPLSESEIMIVPVLRRGRELLRVAVVPRLGPSERCLRLLFGASNHISVHLDRVLAVADAEQGRFRATLDSMPHAVVLTDASFRIVQANASAEALLPRLDLDASGALRSVGSLDLSSLCYDVLAGRRASAEGDARLPDGGCLEITAAAWRDGAGRTDGLVVVMLDVTATRRLREEISQSEKLSSLGRMIAGVAHELNNPLTAVIGYAQLLQTMPPGEKARARLETVRKEAERCRRIVQNLLRFARPHAPERRAMSLNEVAEGVAMLLAYPVRAKGCRIVLELDRALASVVGDRHEIEQALVNLVTNAQHAMLESGRPGAITIRTRAASDARVVLEVDDEGPGVPEEMRAKIFDPFFTTKPVGQGTGLGLWLVYNAVTEQGGTIEIENSDAGGARFRMEFPAAGAPVAEAAAEADEFEATSRVSAKILVLDAEAALASLICEALESEGHRAVAANEASDALARLAGEEFDLLVSDAELPGLPGERLADEVERIRPSVRARILLTTGEGDSREPEMLARRLGAGLIRKPFELEELRRVVRRRLHSAAEP